MNTYRKPAAGSKKPSPISGIVESVIGSLGLRNSYQGWLVVQRWPDIVGEHIARRSEAIRYDDGILYVAVSNSVWRQELAMQTEHILREIRSLPYGRVVRQLRLVHGKKGT